MTGDLGCLLIKSSQALQAQTDGDNQTDFRNHTRPYFSFPRIFNTPVFVNSGPQ